jgi:hypothetical protein
MGSEFQLIGYLQLLAEHDVEYLIVGGVGSRIQGAATTTQDLDIMPDPDPDNLERLALALSSSGTQKKPSNSTTYQPHPKVASLEFKTERIVSLETSYGVIDVLMEVPGVGFYENVRRNAKRYEHDGRVLVVADINDIITSKETTDRSKDWRAMDALYEARDRLRAESDDYEIGPHSIDDVGRLPDD